MYLFSYVYDILVTYPLTRAVYSHFAAEFNRKFPGKKVSMIDVGTGTGTPLKSIMNKVSFSRVLAVDINTGYLKLAKKSLAEYPEVEVKYQDFMTFDKDANGEKFDIVFFGFSYMLMPDRVKALTIARSLLKPGGKIYMFLTLYEKKNKFIEWVKPKMKYLFSIEFGPVVYTNDLHKNFSEAGFEIVSKEKLGGKLSFILRLFKIYAYEVRSCETPLLEAK
jgi:ubiquinone/menaquinone biosynthesis C-methylase UbiE